ncbi:MAG: FAD-binding protein, partial [Gammaproteobacteria bacterium]|nr:FAD-binding protein [Gammaproteobacteria bacterium]
MSRYDVVVIGGGAAGLSFGCSLAESHLRVLILERQSLDELASPRYDGRDFAITHFSKKVMQRLGLWERIAADEIAPLKQARVVDGDSDYTLAFTAQGRGVDELGYLISNHTIRQAIYDQLMEAENVELRAQQEVVGVRSDAQGATVILANG